MNSTLGYDALGNSAPDLNGTEFFLNPAGGASNLTLKHVRVNLSPGFPAGYFVANNDYVLSL